MHFSIPDTQEFFNQATGSSYTGYNIFINGNFHCCLRYKQLHSLHEQLKRTLSSSESLPSFPPKKLFPLTLNQLEQRRVALERYIQHIGQDHVISKSELLRTFFLNAQQESSSIEARETTVDVFLMNGYRIEVNCYTTECSSKVLEKACQHINLPAECIYYFSLFLMRKESDDVVVLVRKLMDFEAPYVSQRLSEDCQIIVRKSFWDPRYDQQLIQDKIALNLLYIQTVSDIERDWIIATNDIKKQLRSLQDRGNKKDYLDIARKLPSYGSVQFSNAMVDYPEQNTMATIVIGNRDLSIRTVKGLKIQETKFKVTRMRCWRVTTLHNNEEISSDSSLDSNVIQNFELSFEYLMTKNCLKWITISSDQAMLMSVCLQGMVDELINQKDSNEFIIKSQSRAFTPLSYVRRDGGVDQAISDSSSSDTISSLNEIDLPIQSQKETFSGRRKSQNRGSGSKNQISTTVFFRNGQESVHNEAFEGIGDDDL